MSTPNPVQPVMPEPTVFFSDNQWWCSASVGQYLVFAMDRDEGQARRNWKEEYKKLQSQLKERSAASH